MKAKSISQNISRAIAAFLLTGASVVAIWSVATYDKAENMYYTQNTGNNTELCCATNNTVSNTDMNQMEGINKEISKIEKKRTNMMNALKKAKADRDKNYGMVAGIYHQPAQDMAEIINLEKKIEKLDNKIAALQKEKINNTDDYSSNVKQLALR